MALHARQRRKRPPGEPPASVDRPRRPQGRRIRRAENRRAIVRICHQGRTGSRGILSGRGPKLGVGARAREPEHHREHTPDEDGTGRSQRRAEPGADAPHQCRQRVIPPAVPAKTRRQLGVSRVRGSRLRSGKTVRAGIGHPRGDQRSAGVLERRPSALPNLLPLVFSNRREGRLRVPGGFARSAAGGQARGRPRDGHAGPWLRSGRHVRPAPHHGSGGRAEGPRDGILSRAVAACGHGLRKSS